jgi:hypothetical protein
VRSTFLFDYSKPRAVFKTIEPIEKLIELRFLWPNLSHSSILAYTALVEAKPVLAMLPFGTVDAVGTVGSPAIGG